MGACRLPVEFIVAPACAPPRTPPRLLRPWSHRHGPPSGPHHPDRDAAVRAERGRGRARRDHRCARRSGRGDSGGRHGPDGTLARRRPAGAPARGPPWPHRTPSRRRRPGRLQRPRVRHPPPPGRIWTARADASGPRRPRRPRPVPPGAGAASAHPLGPVRAVHRRRARRRPRRPQRRGGGRAGPAAPTDRPRHRRHAGRPGPTDSGRLSRRPAPPQAGRRRGGGVLRQARREDPPRHPARPPRLLRLDVRDDRRSPPPHRRGPGLTLWLPCTEEGLLAPPTHAPRMNCRRKWVTRMTARALASITPNPCSSASVSAPAFWCTWQYALPAAVELLHGVPSLLVAAQVLIRLPMVDWNAQYPCADSNRDLRLRRPPLSPVELQGHARLPGHVHKGVANGAGRVPGWTSVPERRSRIRSIASVSLPFRCPTRLHPPRLGAPCSPPARP